MTHSLIGKICLWKVNKLGSVLSYQCPKKFNTAKRGRTGDDIEYSGFQIVPAVSEADYQALVKQGNTFRAYLP